MDLLSFPNVYHAKTYSVTFPNVEFIDQLDAALISLEMCIKGFLKPGLSPQGDLNGSFAAVTMYCVNIVNKYLKAFKTGIIDQIDHKRFNTSLNPTSKVSCLVITIIYLVRLAFESKIFEILTVLKSDNTTVFHYL